MGDVTSDGRCVIIHTGLPAVRFVACARCGVLLSDVDKHYRHAHGIKCVVDDCSIGPFASVAELNAHSREHHVEEHQIHNSDLVLRRYPGADHAGDFMWHQIE